MNPYVRIARPDHWFKNIFMLPGTGLAILLFGSFSGTMVFHLFLGLVAACLLASANYVINEYLDAEFDRFHPVKNQRPGVLGLVEAKWVFVEYAALGLVGMGIAFYLGGLFFTVSALFLLMGFLYNVRPFRLKERVVVDVLSESINNPIRFVLGWAVVEKSLIPPSSVLLAYWFGGAFLMAVKRYSEYCNINDPERAGLYRRSFRKYTSNILLLSAFFYAMNSALFLGVFLIKYHIEFLLFFPFLAILFTWYLWYGLKRDGVAENPEVLYQKKWFVLYTAFVCCLLIFLFVVDVPSLSIFLEERFISLPITR